MPRKCLNCKKKFRTYGLSYMIYRRLCGKECRKEWFTSNRWENKRVKDLYYAWLERGL